MSCAAPWIGMVLACAIVMGSTDEAPSTARRRSESEELRRLNRTLRALSSSSQALLHATDEAHYLEEVCRIVVEDCGHAMVWVGFAEDDPDKTVRPVAYAGLDEGYLKGLRVTWSDSERGRGPTGTAIRTGRPSACPRMQTDPRFGPWREEATRRGYASSIVFPLMSEGKAFGAITIYSREPDPFSDEEQRLLAELANVLAYGIVAIRGRAARQGAEEALRRSEALYRAIARNIPGGGLYVVDRDLRYVVVEGSLPRLFSMERQRSEGRALHETLDGEICEMVEERFRRALAGETASYEWEYRGRVLWSHYVPLRDDSGGVDAAMLLSMDITERTRAEEALREADRRRNEFIGVLSHELRNPLTPLRNAAYVLDRAEPGGEQASRARAVIGRQIDHMAHLVDDLLDATRISRGKIQLARSRIELTDTVRRAVEDHTPEFATREIALELRAEAAQLWLDADPTRIAQVVGNLLQNAAKFTSAQGRVTVFVEREPGDRAVIRVVDDGVGITPALLPKVFEPFIQGDESLHRSQGGLGLGLSLVKGLVELHGGTVQVRSEGTGCGAELTVRLPLAVRRSGPAPRAPPRALPPSRRRVLVIEDNLDAAETLGELLSLAGHEVETAHDGADGLRKALSFNPEVVLCDIGLPGMNGYDVARAMRAAPALASAVLVAVTGYALPEDQKRAAEAGFDHHLSKPVSLEQIHSVVASSARG